VETDVLAPYLTFADPQVSPVAHRRLLQPSVERKAVRLILSDIGRCRLRVGLPRTRHVCGSRHCGLEAMPPARLSVVWRRRGSLDGERELLSTSASSLVTLRETLPDGRGALHASAAREGLFPTYHQKTERRHYHGNNKFFPAFPRGLVEVLPTMRTIRNRGALAHRL